MQPLRSPRARRGHHFCIRLLTGPDKPEALGVRKALCTPSAEEDERSCVRRAGSEVQAWRSRTRAREEAGNPRPGGHRPLFPGVAVAGKDLLPLFPPWHGPSWGLATPGGRTGANRPLESPGSRGLGSPRVSHRHHHLSATSRQRGQPPRSCHPPPLPAAGDKRGLPPGRAPGRGALPLPTARAAGRAWQISPQTAPKDSCKG